MDLYASDYDFSRFSPSVVTQQSEPITGRMSTGMSPDETKMVGAGIGTAVDVGSTLLGGYMESREKGKAAAEDKAEFMRQRARQQEQQKKKNALDKQSLEAEEEQAAYRQWIESQNLRHTMFGQRLKQRVESRQKLISGFERLKQSTTKNADIRNAILSSFRR